MKKVQFFFDSDIANLQEKINEWLNANKEISITGSNLSSILETGRQENKYVFYILYSYINTEIKEMMLAAQENTPLLATAESVQDDILKLNN